MKISKTFYLLGFIVSVVFSLIYFLNYDTPPTFISMGYLLGFMLIFVGLIYDILPAVSKNKISSLLLKILWVVLIAYIFGIIAGVPKEGFLFITISPLYFLKDLYKYPNFPYKAFFSVWFLIMIITIVYII